MSKQNSEKAVLRRKDEEKLRTINKIPDLEWLFSEDEKKKKNKQGGNNELFIQKLLRKNWAQVIYSTLLYLLQCSPVWILPLITSDVIDVITVRPDGYMTRLIIDGLLLLVLLIQNVPTTMWRLAITNRMIRSTSAAVKSGVVRKLQRLSITYHKEIEEGRIQSKFLRDIENVEGYYRNYMQAYIPNVIGLVVSIIIALLKSPGVTLFFVAIIPINVLLKHLFFNRIKKDSSTFRQENEKLSSKLTTTLQMMQLTKAHGLVSNEENAVNEKIDSVTKAGLKLDKTHSIFGSMMWVSGQIMAATCLFFCVFLALKGYITPGEVVLFQSLFSSISGSVLALINIYPALMTGREAVHSLSEIICAEDVERDDGRSSLRSVQGKVDFCNVSYHYPNEEKCVVKDFDLHVKQGERIAIVGASGSGKSTVMNYLK